MPVADAAVVGKKPKGKNMLILDRAMEEEFEKTMSMFDYYVQAYQGSKKQGKALSNFDMEREKWIANDVPFEDKTSMQIT
mmetsp:Transcript_17002/g.26219  ORF Transcript_17002/g.26219 Transcript_17002/m.26219 type:complete len:80 (+) Transcript_17002:4207-4446(+)